MSDTAKLLLSVAAIAVAMFGGQLLPALRGLWGMLPAKPTDRPEPPELAVQAATEPFTDAVDALNVVVDYLVAGREYGAAQVEAAKVLRAAMVEAATPKPPSTGGFSGCNGTASTVVVRVDP